MNSNPNLINKVLRASHGLIKGCGDQKRVVPAAAI